MLQIDSPALQELLLSDSSSLEKEGLRIDEAGFLAHMPHPFPDDPNIVRDFCENQTEINTSIQPSPHAAVTELERHTRTIQRTLAKQTPREYLWPFSNPPYIVCIMGKETDPFTKKSTDYFITPETIQQSDMMELYRLLINFVSSRRVDKGLSAL